MDVNLKSERGYQRLALSKLQSAESIELVPMDLGVEIDEDCDTITNKGSMWVLDQKLDQPMDEEAGRLRTMYREKVYSLSLSLILYVYTYQSTLQEYIYNSMNLKHYLLLVNQHKPSVWTVCNSNFQLQRLSTYKLT